MQTLDIGEVRPVASHWYDTDGEPAEPTTITLVVTKPDGTETTTNKAGLTQGDTVADWYLDVTVDAVGLWRFTFTGDLNGQTRTESGEFLVGVDSTPPGPCAPWCAWDDVVACTNVDLSSLNSAQREQAIDVATEILWNLTGRVYSGICTTTRSICLGCPMCFPRVCSCAPVNGVDLGIRAPVWAVWDVVVDGTTLDPSEYRLIDRRWLARADGTSFPSGWNLLDDPPRFRATWAYGRQVPEGGRRAAALLAAEVAKACAGQPCQLPAKATHVTREGVSFNLLDSQMIEDGRTGVAMVDLWVVADRRGRRKRPRVFSPGAAAARFVR